MRIAHSRSPNRLAEHVKYMRLALREARRAEAEGEVPVGAVLVKDGSVIARAHNRPIHLNDPSGHAEILALRRGAKRLGNYRLSGCSLYVTIEPCAMCAGAIVQARIACLIYGAGDKKAGACGSALRVLNHRRLNHRVALRRGVLEDEGRELLTKFFQSRRNDSSRVAVKKTESAVLSADSPRLVGAKHPGIC